MAPRRTRESGTTRERGQPVSLFSSLPQHGFARTARLTRSPAQASWQCHAEPLSGFCGADERSAKMFFRSERLFLRPGWPEDWAEILTTINDEGVVCNLASCTLAVYDGRRHRLRAPSAGAVVAAFHCYAAFGRRRKADRQRRSGQARQGCRTGLLDCAELLGAGLCHRSGARGVGAGRGAWPPPDCRQPFCR